MTAQVLILQRNALYAHQIRQFLELMIRGDKAAGAWIKTLMDDLRWQGHGWYY